MNKSAAVAQSYRPAERNSALAKLMRFAARPKYKELHRAALALFWGDWLSEKPDHQLEEVMTSEQVEIAYNSWLAFDFDCGGGRRMLDDYLETEGNKLSSGELNYLNGLRGSHLRLYEILEVKPDQGFEVRDLWDDRRLYVRERAATRQIVVWDLIVARIGPGGDGETVFETIPYLFRAADKDGLLKGLRKAHQVFTHEFPNEEISDFFKRMAPVFHKLWLERVALPPHPKLITGDGEPFIFARVIFDLLDREEAIRSLADRTDIVDHGDGSYVWLEPAGNLQRSVGTMSFDEKRVVLETTSQKRAEKARDELANSIRRRGTISRDQLRRRRASAQARAANEQTERTGYSRRRATQDPGRVLRGSLPQVARRAGAGSRQPHAAPRCALEDGASQTGRAAQGF